MLLSLKYIMNNTSNGNRSHHFIGVYEYQGEQINCILSITDSYISLKSQDENKTLDLIIPYKRLIYFATLQDKQAIVVDCNFNEETEVSHMFNFTPDIKEEGKGFGNI
jgi:hypothetical protein